MNFTFLFVVFFNHKHNDLYRSLKDFVRHNVQCTLIAKFLHADFGGQGFKSLPMPLP